MVHCSLLIRLVLSGCFLAALAPLASGQVLLNPERPLADFGERWSVLESEPRSVADALGRPAARAPLFILGEPLSEPVWARLDVTSTSGEDVTWIVPLEVDEATVYVVEQGRVLDTLRTGLAVPLRDRQIQTAYPPAIKFDLPAGSDRTLVMELRHDPMQYASGGVAGPVPEPTYRAEQRDRNVTLGAMVGLLLGLALYNLFLFTSFRDRSYLYYVLFLLGSALYWATSGGFVLEYLLPPTSRGYLELNFFGLALAATAYALFARSFLKTSEHAPVLDRVLAAVAGLWVLAALAGLASTLGAPWWLSVQVFAALLSLVMLCTTVAAGVRAHRKGYLPARPYLIASASLVASGFLYIVVWLGWVEVEWNPTVLLQLGMAVEALLFATALSQRIRLLDSQRSKAVAARELAEATNEALLETDALRTDLLGFAAHDLRSPLTGIVGYAELIAYEASPDSELAEFAEVIRKEADRMLVLIDDLLVTSALDGRAIELDQEPTDLSKMLREVVASYQPRAEAKGQTLTLEAEPETMASLDRARFRDVLDNVVSNAVKYTPNGGTVHVSLEGGDVLEIRVCDSGPGLTAEDQTKLFGRFQRLSAQPTGGESSTGLGLSIARDLILLHGGSIEVDSEPGDGATFVVTLPALAPAEA
ncbi:sensor histidine kinase [Rubrivirga sp.]|uniref:sensor histidine kinase n=1 Tax=Rubrivirga sp. TaxID=1885344 RepID=UPI003C79005A